MSFIYYLPKILKKYSKIWLLKGKVERHSSVITSIQFICFLKRKPEKEKPKNPFLCTNTNYNLLSVFLNLENAILYNYMEELAEFVDYETEQFYGFIRRHLVSFVFYLLFQKRKKCL